MIKKSITWLHSAVLYSYGLVLIWKRNDNIFIWWWNLKHYRSLLNLYIFVYLQVIDSNPFPGLTVTPVHGVVPVGGFAELKVMLTPQAMVKFDTRVQVAIKGGKTLELRMGGTVEPPTVDIDLVGVKEFFLNSFCFFMYCIF